LENIEKLINGLQQTNPAKRERAIKQLCDFCMTNPGQSQKARGGWEEEEYSDPIDFNYFTRNKSGDPKKMYQELLDKRKK